MTEAPATMPMRSPAPRPGEALRRDRLRATVGRISAGQVEQLRLVAGLEQDPGGGAGADLGLVDGEGVLQRTIRFPDGSVTTTTVLGTTITTRPEPLPGHGLGDAYAAVTP